MLKSAKFFKQEEITTMLAHAEEVCWKYTDKNTNELFITNKL